MKIIIIYLSFFLFPIALFAQVKPIPCAMTDAAFKDHYTTRSQAHIKGHVLHASPSEIKSLTITYHVVNAGNIFQSTFNATLAPDGTFDITLADKLPHTQVFFTFDKYAYICLYIDQGVDLTFDLNKLKHTYVYLNGDGVTFGGTDGVNNRLMNDYILFNKKHNANFFKNLDGLDVKDMQYMSKLDSLFAIQYEVNDIFYSQNGSSIKFLIDSETKTDYYMKKLQYLYRNNLPIDKLDDILIPVFVVSNNSAKYIQFLNYYMRLVKFKNSGQKFSYANLAKYCDSILPPAYSDLIKFNFVEGDVKLHRDLFVELKPTLHFNWSKEYMDSKINELNKKIEKIDSISKASVVVNAPPSNLGKLLLKTQSGVMLYVDGHQSADEFLKNLKTIFAKKLVIIDLWATWCIPCINAMPHGKKLHKQTNEANLPVEYVYICTSLNSSEEKWKNKVLEIDQPGIHLFVHEKLVNEVMRLFNKGGYPSYLMLHPDGSYDSETISSMRTLNLDTLKEKL